MFTSCSECHPADAEIALAPAPSAGCQSCRAAATAVQRSRVTQPQQSAAAVVEDSSALEIKQESTSCEYYSLEKESAPRRGGVGQCSRRCLLEGPRLIVAISHCFYQRVSLFSGLLLALTSDQSVKELNAGSRLHNHRCQGGLGGWSDC